jgi:hypothetical protein
MLIWIFIFALSMAFFESSIVVYLREIYYPEGFDFPLKEMSQHLVTTEFIRELASIIMIISVAGISFRTFYKRFASFLFIFAIWDIFYYVFLKLLLDWPESLLEWDILFLIPVTWTGPVITPVFMSVLMIVLSFIIFLFSDRNNEQFIINPREWVVLIIGAFVVFLAFIWDYTTFLLENIDLEKWDSLYRNMEVLTLEYTPGTFNWFIFTLGSLVIIAGIFMIYRRNLLKRESPFPEGR